MVFLPSIKPSWTESLMSGLAECFLGRDSALGGFCHASTFVVRMAVRELRGLQLMETEEDCVAGIWEQP